MNKVIAYDRILCRLVFERSSLLSSRGVAICYQVAGSTSSGSGDAPNEVYVLLTSQRGLSRRCRAAWFLQRLGDELEEGLEERLIFTH